MMLKNCFNYVDCGKVFKNCRFKNNTNNNITNIDYNKLIEIRKQNKACILLDVRSVQEYNEVHLNNAILIPLYELENTVEKVIVNKNSIVIAYCSSGIRSLKALKILEKKGYNNLYNLDGGLGKYNIR